ncbi:MAG: hypothetical protein H6948_13150 [Zoogloeaceae bacterium]|nr:hypothetical protein [Zoogloeaceae bacterium]
MQSRVDRQLRALALAKACAACGARVRTIGHLTGLPPREALRLLFPDRLAVPRGRSPDSPEWYHGANLLHRAEASIVVALYRRLRDADFPAGEALVGAYRHYVGICQPPHRISFDRAFDLAAHTDGLWLTDTRSFSLVTCPACHSEFLAAFGSVARVSKTTRSASWYSGTGRTRGCRGRFRCNRAAAPSARVAGMLVTACSVLWLIDGASWNVLDERKPAVSQSVRSRTPSVGWRCEIRREATPIWRGRLASHLHQKRMPPDFRCRKLVGSRSRGNGCRTLAASAWHRGQFPSPASCVSRSAMTRRGAFRRHRCGTHPRFNRHLELRRLGVEVRAQSRYS